MTIKKLLLEAGETSTTMLVDPTRVEIENFANKFRVLEFRFILAAKNFLVGRAKNYVHDDLYDEGKKLGVKKGKGLRGYIDISIEDRKISKVLLGDGVTNTQETNVVSFFKRVAKEIKR